MPEFEYRGYRVRTVFEKDWRIRIWPPVKPADIVSRIRASRQEGEVTCRNRATAVIDTIEDRPTRH